MRPAWLEHATFWFVVLWEHKINNLEGFTQIRTYSFLVSVYAGPRSSHVNAHKPMRLRGGHRGWSPRYQTSYIIISWGGLNVPLMDVWNPLPLAEGGWLFFPWSLKILPPHLIPNPPSASKDTPHPPGTGYAPRWTYCLCQVRNRIFWNLGTWNGGLMRTGSSVREIMRLSDYLLWIMRIEKSHGIWAWDYAKCNNIKGLRRKSHNLIDAKWAFVAIRTVQCQAMANWGVAGSSGKNSWPQTSFW